MKNKSNQQEINDLSISDADILQITIFNEVFKNLEYCKHEVVYRAKINLALSLEQVKQLDDMLNNLINN